VLFAFDLLEIGGDNLRDLPLIEHKRRAMQFVEHLTGDGPTIFDHICRLGLEGIVSKQADAPRPDARPVASRCLRIIVRFSTRRGGR
jgi:bifunctional non-homologous end joining protein LigD